MEKNPTFHFLGNKKKKPPVCIRNFHCQHYNACMDEAAMKNLLLDCKVCDYKLDGCEEC